MVTETMVSWNHSQLKPWFRFNSNSWNHGISKLCLRNSDRNYLNIDPFSKYKYHTNTIQIPYKYNTNTTKIPHKCHTTTSQISHKYYTNIIQIPSKYTVKRWTIALFVVDMWKDDISTWKIVTTEQNRTIGK